jgi:hypothetical protein
MWVVAQTRSDKLFPAPRRPGGLLLCRMQRNEPTGEFAIAVWTAKRFLERRYSAPVAAGLSAPKDDCTPGVAPEPG